MRMNRVSDSELHPDALGRLVNDVGFLAARWARITVRAANGALEDLGLTTRQYAVLEIALSGGGVNQREIGQSLRLDPSGIVAIVDELGEAGLVRRSPDPSDRRRVLVTATPAGSALADVAAERMRGTFDAILAEHLPESLRAPFTESLTKLALSVSD